MWSLSIIRSDARNLYKMAGENYPALTNRTSSQLSVQSIPAIALSSLYMYNCTMYIHQFTNSMLGRWPSIPFAFALIFLGPSEEEEKVVNGLLDGCSLALRGYTQGKAPILSFFFVALENIIKST